MKGNNRNQGGCEEDVPLGLGKKKEEILVGKGRKKREGWGSREG